MINVRNNKGITLMAEVIAVIVLMIIISMISYSSVSSLQVKNLNNMYADILNIQEKAANYYLKYGEAPIDNAIQVDDSKVPADQKNINDEAGKYYKIDLSKFSNLTLNNEQTEESFYYMNTKTLTTYHTKGVTINKLNGDEAAITYYTLPANYEVAEGTEKIDVEKYQSEI